MPVNERYRAETLHESLGDPFFDRVEAASFPQHRLRYRNQRWAARVGLDGLSDAEWLEHFGRFTPLPGGLAQPLALRYHGHQFRVYNADLGDGRGFLFAQLRDAEDGRLLDLGTKGSGQTPWSRRGDGRLTLKGGVREILATEMLEALGVDSSKTFSLIETGEALVRGDEPSPTRASVLVRLSHSHIRIGTFQRLAFHDDKAAIDRLLDYVCRHYFPALADLPAQARARAFLEEVVSRVARLGAGYMAAGFVHGVLNSDNINVTGESFDYGPWRFAPVYDPNFTAAYFDETGLYAFGRQPSALGWNLSRLAECLLHLTGLEAAEKIMRFASPPRSSGPFEPLCSTDWRWRRRARRPTRPWRKRLSIFSMRRARPSSRPSSTGAAASRALSAQSAALPPPTMRRKPSRPYARPSRNMKRRRRRASTTPISGERRPARC